MCREADVISDGFAMNIAEAVKGPGAYSGVASPNGGEYYFSCDWRVFGAGQATARLLVCGLPPTDITGGGLVALAPS
ncbi:MAG: hypothetical protein ACH36H_03315 [Candidatus Nanopelagicales bacterium]